MVEPQLVIPGGERSVVTSAGITRLGAQWNLLGFNRPKCGMLAPRYQYEIKQLIGCTGEVQSSCYDRSIIGYTAMCNQAFSIAITQDALSKTSAVSNTLYTHMPYMESYFLL